MTLSSVTPAPTQAATEYMAVAAESAAHRLLAFMGQAGRWASDHPVMVGVAVALMVLLIWNTRPSTR